MVCLCSVIVAMIVADGLLCQLFGSGGYGGRVAGIKTSRERWEADGHIMLYV
jgi:hypothetical protein